ncbi:hypothetical protein [Streptomyces sp. NPDC086989]|uniref:hypothetical protein n=1 Tax=Streptomyces sp. NPDC086989 TaxID=3365764 RepID=UPI00382EFBE3
METAEHSILTHDGIFTVEARQPVPGLLVYQIPDTVTPDSRYRWTLGHHSGLAIASFEDSTDATQAAEAIAQLADWTASNEQIRAAILPNAELRQRYWDTVQGHGGLHPSDAAEVKKPRPVTEADIRMVADRYEGDDTDGVAIISGMAVNEPFMYLDDDAFNDAFDRVMRIVHPEHYAA